MEDHHHHHHHLGPTSTSTTTSTRANENDNNDEYFGGEHIRSVAGSNPMIARGAFGEISLAIYCSSSDNNAANENQHHEQEQEQEQPNRFLRLVAVKTLIRPHARHCHATTTNHKHDNNNESNDDCCPIANELQALRILNPHANIVQLLAVYPVSHGHHHHCATSLCAAFAYCPVDLDLALSWRRRTLRPLLSIYVIQCISRDLLAALHHCHAQGILHRDVKPQNCLISSSTGCVQLCDFGLALRLPATTRGGGGDSSTAADAPESHKTLRNQDTRLCTLHYRPPEVLLGARAMHPSVDIYSAGLTIVEVLSGDGNDPFFRGTNDLSQLACIFKALGTPTRESWPLVDELPDWGKLTFTTQAPMRWTDLVPRAAEACGGGNVSIIQESSLSSSSSSCLVDFLQGCIRLDPAQRRSAANCLKHAWLAPAASAGGINSNTCRATIVRELVPPELREPLLLAPPPPRPSAAAGINNDSNNHCSRCNDNSDEDWTVVECQVLRHATTRRGFLKSLETWKD